MILFNEIVEVFDLPQFTIFWDVTLRFQLSEGFEVSRVFINVEHTWRTRMRGREGFEKEVLGGTSISAWTQPKIERVSLRIDGPIKVHPHLFYLYICFIN